MIESIEWGRHVILSEAAALQDLAAVLDQRFGQAADIIAECAGKVIVSGMGKSGHIGRKLAATFQSTGTPAAFLHPAEASHGDMGIIGASDVLLLLSNSGLTDEMRSVVDYAAARGNPMIVVTSRQASWMAAAATVALILPDVPEGCPIDKAPMASSAMMLALGDGLAASLMVRRGFTAEDFLALHHGGYLGRVLSAVA